jgi:hypothetical protein
MPACNTERWGMLNQTAIPGAGSQQSAIPEGGGCEPLACKTEGGGVSDQLLYHTGMGVCAEKGYDIVVCREGV